MDSRCSAILLPSVTGTVFCLPHLEANHPLVFVEVGTFGQETDSSIGPSPTSMLATCIVGYRLRYRRNRHGGEADFLTLVRSSVKLHIAPFGTLPVLEPWYTTIITFHATRASGTRDAPVRQSGVLPTFAPTERGSRSTVGPTPCSRDRASRSVPKERAWPNTLPA